MVTEKLSEQPEDFEEELFEIWRENWCEIMYDKALVPVKEAVRANKVLISQVEIKLIICYNPETRELHWEDR